MDVCAGWVVVFTVHVTPHRGRKNGKVKPPFLSSPHTIKGDVRGLKRLGSYYGT